MIAFMFGVLGSLLFWAIYLPVSFVIAVVMMRKIMPSTMDDLAGKSAEVDGVDKLCGLFLLAGFMAFWPVIAVIYVVLHVFLGQLGWGFLSGLISKAENAIPEVKVSFGSPEEKKEE
jgi:hypothetical protein